MKKEIPILDFARFLHAADIITYEHKLMLDLHALKNQLSEYIALLNEIGIYADNPETGNSCKDVSFTVELTDDPEELNYKSIW